MRLVERISELPYDVLNSEEARQTAEGNPMSLFHITRPEINFPAGTDEHDERVYGEAKKQYDLFKTNGWLVQDAEAHYYIYAQTRLGKTQHGIMLTAAAEDYKNGVILRHELTRRDKEDDRMRHIMAYNAQMGPAFFAFPRHEGLSRLVSELIQTPAEYDFTSADGIRHQMWVVTDAAHTQYITQAFSEMPHLYIADGHHRTAAAARVAEEGRNSHPNHTGDEEYNYIMAVAFPEDELTILDYNRVMMDLNGKSAQQLLAALAEDFDLCLMGATPYKPQELHEFSLYVDGDWYSLRPHEELIHDEDPIESLDVAISSKWILDKQFGITDLRGDKRIDFIGGIRGLEELQKRVDSGEAACALALYPTTMQQIFRVADTGNIMPPKATWFEPKLRSGIVIHEI